MYKVWIDLEILSTYRLKIPLISCALTATAQGPDMTLNPLSLKANRSKNHNTGEFIKVVLFLCFKIIIMIT